MAADSTAICNLALNRMGQPTIDSISGTDVLEEKCNLIYTQMLEELLTEGPEKGWKFARRRYHGTDDHNITITAFADGGSGEVDVTATAHGLVVGDMVEIDGTTNYDGTYDVVGSADANTFSVVATFVADDATGTAHWRSEEYTYRYAIPSSCLQVLKVQVGGIELTDWEREDDYIMTNQESAEIDIIYIYNETTTTKFPPQFTRVLVLKIAVQLHYNLTQDLNAIQALEFDLQKAMSKAWGMDGREQYVQEYSNSWQNAGHTTDFLE
jgi:hypothetical protein